MMSQEVPLIILHFNQPTYLRNLVNWWQWYRGDDPIHILDNVSTSPQALAALEELEKWPTVTVHRYEINAAKLNLRSFIDAHIKTDYYVISDADIMPHPATPPNFLEIFKHAIEVLGYHHVGFGLLTDIPEWTSSGMRSMALKNERNMRTQPITVEFEGVTFTGHRAPIDTTFALYTTKNSGWENPVKGPDWNNALRLFDAFHLSWYLSDTPNAEMDTYYKTCNVPIGLSYSHGNATYRPSTYDARFNTEVDPQKERFVKVINSPEHKNYGFTGVQDWHPFFEWLFKKWVPSTFFEFGLGVGTEYFLDSCPAVTSLEIAARPPHREWWEKSLKSYAAYQNWEPHFYEASDNLKAIDKRAQGRDYPSDDRSHIEELQSVIDRTMGDRKFDLIFVDSGLHIRGDLLNLVLPLSDVVAAHDTRASTSIYGWHTVEAPNHVQIEFPGNHFGTTFWINPSRSDLIEHLQQFPA
jgi:hypothetical protein